MTNAPTSRKTHVIRILGTNKNDDVLPDIWADVERIDVAKTLGHGSSNTFLQGTERRLKWQDDPNANDYKVDGNESRRVKIVKVCSPDEADLNDPEEWVPIPVAMRLNLKNDDQGQVQRFLNSELGATRKVEVRRIEHWDTNIDEEAQAAFDADPTLKAYVVPADRYEKTPDTKDDGQYVEHEIVMGLKRRSSGKTGTGNGNDQGEVVKVLNQYLVDESVEAQLVELGENNFNPPYRLDPYQNIVNVQLGGATEFEPGACIGQISDLASSSKFSLSMWVWIPETLPDYLGNIFTPSLGLPILQFGKRVDFNENISDFWGFEGSAIYITRSGTVFALLAGGHKAFNIDSIAIGNNGDSVGSYVSGSPSVTMFIQGSSDDKIEFGKWNHIALSVDTAEGDLHQIGDPDVFSGEQTGTYKGRLVVNGFNAPPRVLNDLSVLPDAFTEVAIGYAGFDFSEVSISWINWTYPPFELNFVGQFGLPVQLANASSSAVPMFTLGADRYYLQSNPVEVAYAGVQVWTGKFIDWHVSSNLRKVFEPSGGDAELMAGGGVRMVPVRFGQEAFGESVYLLDGAPSSFIVNRGTSGEMNLEIGDRVFHRKPSIYVPTS